MKNFIEGNYEDKYNAKNPVSKLLMNNFLNSFKSLLSDIDEGEIETVCEVGVGEGSLLKSLVNIFPKAKYWATDLSDNEVKKAKKNLKSKKNVNFSVQNAENLFKFKDKQFDLVICCEVLEHVKNYRKALNELRRISRKYILISVPNEPIWRILNMTRGKYLFDLGNTPGHLNHWSKSNFIKFIEKEGLVIIDKKYPFPWQMILMSGNNLSIPQELEGKLSPFLRSRRYLAASKSIEPHSLVLDIGCGSGDFRKYLKGCDYFGINLFKAWSGKRNNLVVCDVMQNIPYHFDKIKFDYVIALAFLEHVKNPEIFFKLVKPVLKKNGKIIITTPHPISRNIHDIGAKLGFFSCGASEEHEKFIELKTMMSWAKKEGFKLISYKRFLFGLNQLLIIKI